MKHEPGKPLPPEAEGELETTLAFDIVAQPDDATCGPTCLHGVYGFYRDPLPLEQVIAEVDALPAGGTLAAHLAVHALRRGYRAEIAAWDLAVLDPTWFAPGAPPLIERLSARAARQYDPRRRAACESYLRFLELGGELSFEELSASLLRGYLRRGLPVLTGLSATYLYREPRELADGTPDDVLGDPVGHFVVLTGYTPGTRTVRVTDPSETNPLASGHTYPVPISRVVGAIFLGALTHDANLLVIQPRTKPRHA